MRTLVWDDPEALAHVSWYGGWRGYAFPEHGHANFWELVLVRRGMLAHQLGGVWQRQGVGWLTLLRGPERHALRGDEVEYVNCSFLATIGAELVAPLPLRDQPLCLHLNEPQHQRLEADLEALAKPLSLDHGRVILSQVLAGIARAVCERERAASEDQPAWLTLALARLARADPVATTLADLRAWAGVSVEHLARSLRRHHGCTPSQLLRRRRLAVAARLLSASDDTVEAIARRCGWADLPLFHRQFRRCFGLTPGALRARERRFIAAPEAER